MALALVVMVGSVVIANIAPASAQTNKRICGWYVEQVTGSPSVGGGVKRFVFVAKVNRGDSRNCDDAINRLLVPASRITGGSVYRTRVSGDYCETTGRWVGRNPVDICLQMPADWGQGPYYTSWTFATSTFLGNYYNPS